MSNPAEWPAGAGMTAELVRRTDWAKTPLGAVQAWPESLRATIEMLLACSFPMVALWGSELVQIYNDGYAEIMGIKHPAGMGQPTRECWPEVWNINEPIYAQVLAGKTLTFENALYPITRSAVLEDAYFTLCYSPLRDSGEVVAGVLVTVFETTKQLTAEGERRNTEALAREDALRKSEQKFHALFAASPAPFLILKPDAPNFTITEGNDAYLAATSRTRDELVGLGVFQAFPDNPQQPAFSSVSALCGSLERVLASRQADALPGLKYDVPLPDGTFEERWWSPINSPLFDANGKVEAIIHNANDVTEEHRAGSALRESEQKLRGVANIVPDLLWYSEPDGSTPWYNDRWLKYTGQSLEQASGWGWVDAIHPDDREGSAKSYREAVEQSKALQQEHRIRSRSGEYRWFLIRSEPVRDEHGRVTRMYGAATDIHDQRLALEALRESEEKYRDLFERIDEGFCVVELLQKDGRATDYRLIEVNPAFEKQTGLTNATGKLRTEIALLGEEAAWLETYDEVARSGKSQRFERFHEPTQRWYDVYVASVAHTDPPRLTIVFAEITARKQADAALRESEENYRNLYTSMGQGYIQVELVRGPDGHAIDYRYLQLNPAYERLTGIPVEKAVGQLSLEVIPDLSPFWAQTFERVVDSGVPAEFDYEEKALDRWFGIHTYPTGGDRLTVLALDITERKKAEAALRESEEKYRLLFQTMDEGYLVADVIVNDEGKAVDIAYVASNAAAIRMVGTDLTGKRLREVSPDYEEYWFQIWGEVAVTGKSQHHTRWAAPEKRWYEFNVFKPEPENLDSRRVAVLFQDVTERKRAETALRESEERQAFLLKLSDALRPLRDVMQIQRAAMALLGEKLAVNRAACYQVADDEVTFFVTASWERGAPPPLPELMRITDYGEDHARAYRAGRTEVERDTEQDIASDDIQAAVRPLQVRAWIGVPLVKEGRWFASIGVHSLAPREWTPAEIRLVEDIAERTWDAVERARAETALRESEERFRTMADNAPVLIWETDQNGATSVNRHYTDFFGVGPDELLGMGWANFLHPDDAQGYFDTYAEAFRQRKAYAYECRFRRADGQWRWLRNSGGPLAEDRFIGCSLDVTDLLNAQRATRESEERQAFLLKLSDALRPLGDPIAIQQAAMQLLGSHLGVNRAFYGEAENDHDTLVIGSGYSHGTFPLEGQVKFSDFELDMAAWYREGRTYVIEDTEEDTRFDESTKASFRPIEVRAAVGVPLVKGGRVCAVVSLHRTTPHRWTESEIALLKEAAERTWAAAERARAEAALRESEERQAFLLRLSDALRPLADTETIQSEAMRLLGEQLGVSRAQYYIADETGEYLSSTGGYTDGVPAAVGRFRLIEFGKYAYDGFHAGETQVVSDAQTDPRINEAVLAAFQSVGFLAFIGVPFVQRGRFLGSVAVHQSVPRQWTDSERMMVEETAQRAGIAIEQARAEEALRASEASLGRELANTTQLQKFSSLLIEGESDEALYGRILDAAMAIMHADFASLQRFDPETNELVLLGHKNFHAESAKAWDRISIDTGTPCGGALKEGGRLFTLDTATYDPEGAEWFRLSGIGSCQSTPLTSRDGRLIGMMSTHWRGAVTPREEDYRSFDVLVRQTADAFERANAAKALGESEERFRLFVENVREYALVQTDFEGIITSCNPGAERLFGYSSAEVTGKPFSMLLPEADRHGGLIAREMAALSRGQRSSDAHFMERKNGSTFFAEWITEPVLDDDGQLRGTAKVLRDETERLYADQSLRASLAEKDALLAEVHHRVKNNLQVITSLLNLQSRGLKNAEISKLFNETRNRVQSIASIHQMVYRSGNFARIDLFAYVKQLVPTLVRSCGVQSRVRVTMEGGGVSLELERAVPFGLLVNEIVSNAIKHGLPPSGTGSLHVTLTGDGETIFLKVKDSGPGFPSDLKPEQVSSLGLRLVHILVRQLGGDIKLKSDTGTSVDVCIPVRAGTQNDEPTGPIQQDTNR